MIRRWLAKLFGRAPTPSLPEPQRRPGPPPPPPPIARAPEPVSFESPQPIAATPEPVRATPEPVRATPEPVRATPEPVRATPEPVRAPEPAPTQEAPDQALISPRPELGGGGSPVRLVFEDGRVENLEADPALQEQLHYLVGNLAPGGENPEEPATVKLVFEDGRVESLSVDPKEASRLAYLVDNLLEPRGE